MSAIDLFVKYGLQIAVGLLMIGGIIVGVTAFKNSLSSSSDGYEVLGDVETMFTNYGDQLGTVGTMLGVGIIIAVIGLAFLGVSYGRRQGYF